MDKSAYPGKTEYTAEKAADTFLKNSSSGADSNSVRIYGRDTFFEKPLR